MRWKTVTRIVLIVLVLLLASVSSFAESTPADAMRALKGVTGAKVEIVRTPIYDSSGCGVDETALWKAVRRHAERNSFRIEGEDSTNDLTLVVSVSHFRVKHTSDCTASVDLTLRTSAEYNGARLPLIVWSSLVLLTVNKSYLTWKVREEMDTMLMTFFALRSAASR